MDTTHVKRLPPSLALVGLTAEGPHCWGAMRRSPLPFTPHAPHVAATSSDRRCTGIALGLSALSVVMMKLPTIIEGGERGTACLGDLYAVAAGMGLGGLLTVNRSAALHAPKAKMIMAPIIGSIFCVVMAAALLAARGHSPLPSCGVPGATVAFIGLAAVRAATALPCAQRVFNSTPLIPPTPRCPVCPRHERTYPLPDSICAHAVTTRSPPLPAALPCQLVFALNRAALCSTDCWVHHSGLLYLYTARS